MHQGPSKVGEGYCSEQVTDLYSGPLAVAGATLRPCRAKEPHCPLPWLSFCCQGSEVSAALVAVPLFISLNQPHDGLLVFCFPALATSLLVSLTLLPSFL